MAKLSVVVIARNEEEMIGDCLESVKWADEIILIDNDSSDDTLKIAKSFAAKVYSLENGSFSDLRNLGAKKATGERLLYIDADERITPLLKKEIQSVKDYSAYAIPRRNILLGHEMRYGGWWPDYVLRLVNKDSLVKWRGELHEQPEIRGEVGKLKQPLVHITHQNLKEMVEKTNEWSEIEARLLFESSHPKMNILRFLSAMFHEFWYRGIKKLGFLDGPVGVIEIIYQVFSKFVTYAKLWEMQLKNK